jgi:hypothetical protein
VIGFLELSMIVSAVSDFWNWQCPQMYSFRELN